MLAVPALLSQRVAVSASLGLYSGFAEWGA